MSAPEFVPTSATNTPPPAATSSAIAQERGWVTAAAMRSHTAIPTDYIHSRNPRRRRIGRVRRQAIVASFTHAKRVERQLLPHPTHAGLPLGRSLAGPLGSRGRNLPGASVNCPRLGTAIRVWTLPRSTHDLRATVTVDRDGVIHQWGEAATEVMGYSAGDTLGTSLDVIIPPVLRPLHWWGFDKAMKSGRLNNPLFKVPALCNDGHIVVAHATIDRFPAHPAARPVRWSPSSVSGRPGKGRRGKLRSHRSTSCAGSGNEPDPTADRMSFSDGTRKDWRNQNVCPTSCPATRSTSTSAHGTAWMSK